MASMTVNSPRTNAHALRTPFSTERRTTTASTGSGCSAIAIPSPTTMPHIAVAIVVMGAAVVPGGFRAPVRRHHPGSTVEATLCGPDPRVRLSLAVGRYEDRRAAVVADANSIGTAYLRAQTLADPVRSRSASVVRRLHGRGDPAFARHPGQRGAGSCSRRRRPAAAPTLAARGAVVERRPVASAPRLYVDSLNNMIDQQTVHVSALNNRVPGAVMALEVLG